MAQLGISQMKRIYNFNCKVILLKFFYYLCIKEKKLRKKKNGSRYLLLTQSKLTHLAINNDIFNSEKKGKKNIIKRNEWRKIMDYYKATVLSLSPP